MARIASSLLRVLVVGLLASATVACERGRDTGTGTQGTTEEPRGALGGEAEDLDDTGDMTEGDAMQGGTANQPGTAGQGSAGLGSAPSPTGAPGGQ